MTLERYTSLRTADLPPIAAALDRNHRNGATSSRGWYSIKNLSEAEAQIDIYDYIGLSGVSADDFVRELASIKASKITLRVNSPGGDVFDGVTIFNAIARHKAEVTAFVDGIAASAASFIIQAADHRVMSPHSTMMIHDAQGGLAINGTAGDYQKMADVLNKASENIASIYAERAGGTQSEWRTLMLAETWLSDVEAVRLGLADRVDGAEMMPCPKCGEMAPADAKTCPECGAAMKAKMAARLDPKFDLSGLKDSALLKKASPTLEGLLGKHSLKEAVTTAGGR